MDKSEFLKMLTDVANAISVIVVVLLELCAAAHEV